jgi:hypothetical protein
LCSALEAKNNSYWPADHHNMLKSQRSFLAAKHLFCLNTTSLNVFDMKGTLKRTLVFEDAELYSRPKIAIAALPRSGELVIGRNGVLQFFSLKKVRNRTPVA